jgi:hypothetical protein
MLRLICFFTVIGSASAADVHTPRSVGVEVAAALRLGDVFLALEEMRSDGIELKEVPVDLAAIMQDPDLEKCTIVFEQPELGVTFPQQVKLEYKGRSCPLEFRIERNTVSTTDKKTLAKIKTRLRIVGDELKQKLNLAEFQFTGQELTEESLGSRLSAQASYRAKDSGAISLKISGELLPGTSGTGVLTESYAGGGSAATFHQEVAHHRGQVDFKYFLNQKLVTAKEFSDNHTDIPIPMMEWRQTPVRAPGVCHIRLYDARSVTLIGLRRAIESGSADLLPMLDISAPFLTNHTGEIKQSLTEIELKMHVTVDALRISLLSMASGRSLGTLATITSERLDVAKAVEDMQVRLTCDAQSDLGRGVAW